MSVYEHIYIYTHINVHTPHYICNDFSSTQFYEVNIFELLGYEGSRIPSLFIMCLGNSLKPVGILLYVHNVSTINYVYTLCIFEVVYNPHVYTCNYMYTYKYIYIYIHTYIYIYIIHIYYSTIIYIELNHCNYKLVTIARSWYYNFRHIYKQLYNYQPQLSTM